MTTEVIDFTETPPTRTSRSGNPISVETESAPVEPKRGRRCSVCGETGHRASRHNPAAKQSSLIPGKNKLSSAQEKQVRIGLSVAVMGVDMGAGLLLPNHWTKEDRLAQEETAMLVSALYSELETFPKALAWLANVAGAGVHVQLAYVVAAIAAPRLARRGIISVELATAIAFAPVLMATGPTPDDMRANGAGQVASDGPVSGGSAVQDSIPQQSGFGGVASSAEDQIIAGLGGYAV